MENLERKGKKRSKEHIGHCCFAAAELFKSTVNDFEYKMRPSNQAQLQWSMNWEDAELMEQPLEYFQPPVKLGVGATNSVPRKRRKCHTSFQWLDHSPENSLKSYYNELYHNTMVNVIDVTDEDSLVAMEDGENFYDNLLQDIVIVPTTKDESVMILNGKHKYQLATIIDFNIAKYEVAVQLNDSKEVVVLRCDDVCIAQLKKII